MHYAFYAPITCYLLCADVLILVYCQCKACWAPFQTDKVLNKSYALSLWLCNNCNQLHYSCSQNLNMLYTSLYNTVAGNLWFLHLCISHFCNCIVPMGFLPWKIWVAFPEESQLWQCCATQPMVNAGCFSVSITHWPLTWTTGSLTCLQM